MEHIWPDANLHFIWDQIFADNISVMSVRNFINALKFKSNKIVLDLGFPVHNNYFKLIPQLKKSGCRIIWFECDKSIALQRFRIRNPNQPISEFETQMRNIKLEWRRIAKEVHPQIINVLKINKTPKTYEELYSEV